MNEENKGNVRERIRIGETEIEVEGTPEYVQSRINQFFEMAARGMDVGQAIVSEQEQQLTRVETRMPDQSENIEVVEGIAAPEQKRLNPSDFLAFYQEKAPGSQGDIVLVISYFYQKYLDREDLSLEDIQEGFKALKKAAVKEPSNYKSSVRNVVDRTDLLYNPGRGQFALTLQGEQYVESMNSSEEED